MAENNKILLDIKINKEALAELDTLLKSTEHSVKQLKKQIVALEKAFEKGSISFEKFNQQFAVLKQAEQQQEQQVKQLTENYKQLNDTIKTLEKSVQSVAKEQKKVADTSLQNDIKNTNVAIGQEISEVAKLTLELKDAKKQLSDNQKEQKKLASEFEAATISADDYKAKTVQLTEAEVAQKTQINKLSTEYRDLTRTQQLNQTIANSSEDTYEKLAAQLIINRKVLRTFPIEYDKLSDSQKQFIKDTNEINEKLKKFDAGVGFFGRNVGDYANKITEALTKFGVGEKTATKIGGIGGGIVSKIGTFGGIAAGVVVLAEGIKKLNETFAENEKKMQMLRQNFGNLGAVLHTNLIQINQLEAAYGVNLEESIKAATAVSKNFGISSEQALAIIRKGFDAGANNAGEFLDVLREYPTVFKNTGLSAQEFVAIQIQAVKEGIYSDKAIDAIKESIISLREYTPATQQALNGLGKLSGAGANFGDVLRNDITNGQITLFDATKKVSAELAKIPNNSKQYGSILADVFRGAGEDAGIFMARLNDLNTDLTKISNETSKYADSSLRLSDAWAKFTTEITSGSGAITKALTTLLDALSDVVDWFTKFNSSTIENELKMVSNLITKYLIEKVQFLLGTLGQIPFVSKMFASLTEAVSFNVTTLDDKIKVLTKDIQLMNKQQLDAKVQEWQNAFTAGTITLDEFSGAMQAIAPMYKALNANVEDNTDLVKANTAANVQLTQTLYNKAEATAHNNYLATEEQRINKDRENGFIHEIQYIEHLTTAEDTYHIKHLAQLDEQAQKEQHLSSERVKRRENELQQLQYIQQIESEGFNLVASLYEQAKQREIKAAGDNATQIEAINRKYLQKEKQRLFAEIVVNGILAGIKAAATGNYAELASVAIAGTFGIAKLALLDEYGKGGTVGGRPHSAGGTMINAERGEFVVNKYAASMNRGLLENINSQRFETGGAVGELKSFQSSYKSRYVEKQPVLVVRDLDNLNNDRIVETQLLRY